MAIQLNGIYNSTGFRMGPASVTATDPYFANVSLLLHGDGTNNSTVITDSSSYAKTVTAGNLLKVTTATKKFGTGSLVMTGGYATTTDTNGFNFGTSDFTIECWMNTTGATGSYQYALTILWGAGKNVHIRFGDAGFGNRMSVNLSDNTFANEYVIADTSATLAGVWHHFALVRSSGSVSFYKDGVAQTMRNNNFTGTPVTSFADASNILSVTNTIVSATSFPLSGYMDDVRITQGIARYTGNFTPPTAAFPNQ